jgi:hypothetical protein
MPLTLPKTGRPRLSAAALEDLLEPYHIDREKYPVVIVGLRGYYKDSMGAPGVDDRSIYDDAIFVHSPSVMAAFNGNTNPSGFRKGEGKGARKGIASLNPGVMYVHTLGKHKGKYLALCQTKGPVTVTRDGIQKNYSDSGYFGINIHKGDYNSTSSEGCQTIHPDQWKSFINLVADQVKRYEGANWETACIPYVLLVGVSES